LEKALGILILKHLNKQLGTVVILHNGIFAELSLLRHGEPFKTPDRLPALTMQEFGDFPYQRYAESTTLLISPFPFPHPPPSLLPGRFVATGGGVFLLIAFNKLLSAIQILYFTYLSHSRKYMGKEPTESLGFMYNIE
jgi:hypothetical protein